MPGEPEDPGGGLEEKYVDEILTISESIDAPDGTTTVSDSVSTTETVSGFDTISVTDTPTYTEATPTVGEFATVTEGLTPNESASIGDTVSATEGLTITETVTTGDTISVTEPLSATETATIFDTIPVTDSLIVTETVTTSIPIGAVTVNDQVIVSESLEVEEPSVYYTTDGIDVQIIPIPWHAAVRVQWTVTPADPEGTIYQVYQDGRLVEETADLSVTLPWPAQETWFRVVRPVDGFSGRPLPIASQPPGSGATRRVSLTWLGGPFLDPVDPPVSYRVYRGTVAGGAVSYTTPIAIIAAGASTPGGWGDGGWGSGGWGSGASQYSYFDLAPTNGTWNYAVRAVDDNGNESTAATASAVVAATPRPGGPITTYGRLTRTYNAATRVATLQWNASPDA
jgi:hypothetical protein